MTGDMPARPVVLFSTGPLKAADNPYLHLLVDAVGGQQAAGAGVEVRYLTPRAALRGRVDLVHVHWPHQMASAATRLRTLVKLLVSSLLLARVRWRGIPVVHTVHNLSSHESAGRWERLLTRRLDRLVSLRIHLNESPENDDSRGVVALHPHYRTWLAPIVAADPPPARGRALLFGRLRPYKGIEALLAAGAEAGTQVTIAGEPWTEDYADHLRALAAPDPGARLLLRGLGEAELVALHHSHDLVVLPYPRMYNSGALWYALSCGVPVLAPRSPVNETVLAEVGPAWVHLYDGPLTGQVLTDALAATARDGSGPDRPGVPDLSRRDPGEHGRVHLAVYRALIAGSRRTGDVVGDQRRHRDLAVADPIVAAHSPRNRRR